MSSSVLQIVVNATDNASGVLSSVGESLRGLGTKMMGIGAATTAVTAPLTIMGVKALDAAGNFEASMNILSVAAASSQTSLEDLSAAALAVGADSELVGISASQAGDAMTEMYKAGLSTNQVFGDMQGYLEGTTSLNGALRAAIDLAAASELDLAGATDVVVKAMNTFGLSASDAGMIADTLVRTADAGVASVSGLADSMVNVGPIAAAMGIGMDDLNIALSLLASRGIEGSEAGTQLKSMLLAMQRDTSDVKGTWDALGLSMYDATGTMKGLPVILSDLEGAMAGMTQEQRNATITTLAGTYGLNAMNILLGEGVTGWDAMSDAVSEAAGVQENAAARTLGWYAALEQLGGVVESIQITALTPFLKNTLTPLAQKAGELLSRFTELDPGLVNLGVIFAAVAIAAGPLLIGLGAMVTGLGALLSPIGLVVVGVAALGLAWATNFGGIRDATQPIVDAVIGFIGRIPAAFDALVAGAQALWADWSGVFNQIASLVSSVFHQISQIIQTVLGIILGSVQQNAGALQALFLNAYTRIKDIVQQALTAVASIVQSILGAVKQFLWTHGADIQNTLADAWMRIATIVNMALEVIQLTVIPILKGIAQFIKEHSEEIQTVLTAAWTIIKNVIDGVLTVIEGLIGAFLAILKGDWEGAWEIIKQTVENVWENIRTILEAATTAMVTVIGTTLVTIYDWFVEKFEAVKGFLQGINLADVGRAIIQGLINGITSMAGALFDAVKGVVDSAINGVKGLVGNGKSSPADVGRNMVRDMTRGIEEMAPGAMAAMASITDGLSGATLGRFALATAGGSVPLNGLNGGHQERLNVTIHIDARGSNGQMVAQAAQTGVLQAARAMGIA